MHFNILTLFPDFFHSPLSCGLLGKAIENGLIQAHFVNPRDFTQDKHRSVDDRPYGGGPGMIMAVDPMLRALKSLSNPGRTILLSPQGRVFDQNLAAELAAEESLTLVCGRYEGLDARFQTLTGAEAVSLGDFVLSGGESAALCLIEAVARLKPEFMGRAESSQKDSFVQGLLEYPQYTRPDVYQGLAVPEILLSGNHQRIADWRRSQSLQLTLKERPELLKTTKLDAEDQAYLRNLNRPRLGRALYIALVHYPVWNKYKQVTAVSLTNLDIHDIARVCSTYLLGGYYLVTPLKDQQELAERLIGHWMHGAGGRRNPDRLKAMQRVHVSESIEEVRKKIKEHAGTAPLTIATSARQEGLVNYAELRQELQQKPVLLLFGTGYGLAPQVLQECDGVLRAIRFIDHYNHLSVRSAVAITVDRILKDFF